MNDLLNAIAGLSHTIYQDEDKKKRIAADAELRNQQVDLQKWQADEMNKFSNRIDFENFQNDYEKDFAAKYAEYNTQKGARAYNSNYAATRGNEMFDQLKVNSQLALNKIIDQQQISYANVKDKQTLDELNTLPPSQNRIDQSVNIIKGAVSENRMSREQGYNELNKIWNQDVYEQALQDFNSWIENHPGAKNADFDNYVENIDNTLELPVIQGITGNKEETLNAAKKVMQQQVYDMQKRTNESVYAANSEILRNVALGTKPQGQLISDIKNQLNMIKYIPDLQISETDKRAREKELYGLLEMYGDKPTPEGETKARVKSFYSMLENDIPTFIEASKMGTESTTAEGAESAYASYTAFMDKWTKIGEEYGIEANKIKLDYTNKFFEQIQREYNHNPKVVSVFNQVEGILKGYINKKDVNYEDLQAEVMTYVWDTLFDSNMTKLDTEGIVENTNKFIENITAKELTLNKIKKDGVFGLTGEYDLPKALQNLSTNDYAWTDEKGIQHFNEKAYDTVIDKVIPEQVEALYAVGVKGHLKVNDTPVSDTGYDIDLMPAYKDEKGNEYTFKSIDKDNYEIYMNGQKYSTSEEVKKNRKNIKGEARDKVNAERDRIKTERKQLRAEAKEIKAKDQQQRKQLAGNNKAPEHIDQDYWQKLDLNQRTALLVQYRSLYPEEYKELLKGANK